MKKFLFVSLALGTILVFALIFYGAYLNKTGETKISEIMADQRTSVRAARVERREMIANVRFPTLKFYTEKMADTITLAGGRIDQIFVHKNDFINEGQIICTIVDDEMPLKIRQAETSIQSAKAKVKAAANKYDRYQRLWDKKATSLSSLEEAELDTARRLPRWKMQRCSWINFWCKNPTWKLLLLFLAWSLRSTKLSAHT